MMLRIGTGALAVWCLCGCFGPKDTFDTDLVDGSGNIILEERYKGEIDSRSFGDLVRHMNRCGIKIEGFGELAPDNAMAESGYRLKIGERFIGVYKYNLEKRSQRVKLLRIKEEGKLYLLGIPFKTHINGQFVMIDAESHEKSEEIIKAFDSFD